MSSKLNNRFIQDGLTIGVIASVIALWRMRSQIKVFSEATEAAKRAPRIPVIVAGHIRSPGFSRAEEKILQLLLNTNGNVESQLTISVDSNFPDLVVKDAAKNLIAQGLIVSRSNGYSQTYSLTDQGRVKVVEMWKARSG